MSTSSSPHNSQQPALPVHLCFLLIILLMFLSFSWYASYESIFEGLFDQLKLVFIVSPLVLLLVIHLFSTFDTSRTRSPFFIPLPEKDSFHSASGTPWGVGFILVILFFLLSYQSDLRERWFPLLS